MISFLTHQKEFTTHTNSDSNEPLINAQKNDADIKAVHFTV